MRLNKRGVALLQVLVISAVLAGLCAMILRVTLSRALTSRQARHTVLSQQLIESCMETVNGIWAAKTPQKYSDDLEACKVCDPSADASGEVCPSEGEGHVYVCLPINVNGTATPKVKASFTEVEDGKCTVTYTIVGGVTSDLLY